MKKFICLFIVFLSLTIVNAQEFSLIYTGPTGYGNGSGEWFDYNSDGNLDLFVNGSTNGGSYSTSLYTGNGSGGFTQNTAGLTMLTYGTHPGSAGDYNNDGKIDLFLTGYYGTSSAYLYRNNGSTFTNITGHGVEGIQQGTVAWGDYDNDGFKDLLVSGWGSTKYSRVYKNNGNGTFTQKASFTGYNLSSAVWADYDNDGNLDFFLCGYTGSVAQSHIYKNNGDGTFSQQQTLTGIYNSSAAWGDYDADGDLDLIVCGINASSVRYTILYKNDMGTFINESNASFTPVSGGVVDWGDFNNDGLPDVLLAGNNGTTRIAKIYVNMGGGVFSEAAETIEGVDNASGGWGDFDGDGDLDFFLSGAYGTDVFSLKAYINNSSQTNGAPTIPNNLSSTNSCVDAMLTWNPSTDDHTPAQSLSYNIRVGTTSGGVNIVSPESNGNYRKVYRIGNAGLKTSFHLKNLAPGTYYWSVQAIDGSNVASAFGPEQSFVVEEPAAITSEPVPFNACDGSVGNLNVAASGTNLNYEWFKNSMPTGVTTSVLNFPMLTTSDAGTYYCEISNVCGMVTSIPATVTVFTNPTATISTTDVSCFAGNNGTATANPSGGTSPYLYSWNPSGQTSQTAINLSEGTYSLTITDVNGCSSNASANIIQPASPLTVSISGTNNPCNGLSSGDATATVSGGTPNYSFSWSNGFTTNTITSLVADTYTVTVVDANGCSDIQSVIITEPPVLTLSVSTTPETCFGTCDGSATGTASGGTPPYNYNWLTGSTTITDVNLCVGSAFVTVTDANSCTVSASGSISGNPAITGTATTTDVSCYGLFDGEATVFPTGGTGTYTYLWDDGLAQTTATATGLGAGLYNCIITDGNSCFYMVPVTINQPDEFVLSLMTYNNPTCYGYCDGNIEVNTINGYGTINYSWNSGQTTANISGLCENNYLLTATDEIGCQATLAVNLTAPAQLTLSEFATNCSCYSYSDGSIDLNVIGGTPPYTYEWTGAYSSEDLAGIASGGYIVTVTDANFCTATISSFVDQPAEILVDAGVDFTVCETSTDFSLNGMVSGATGGIWTGGTGTFIPDATSLNASYSPSIADISGGILTLTLTSTGNGGCSSVMDEIIVTFETSPVVNAGTDNGTCIGESITLSGTMSGSSASTWTSTGTGAFVNPNDLVTIYTPSPDDAIAGTVSFTLTSGNLGVCPQVSDDVVYTIYPDITSSISTTDVSCFGGSDGAIDLTVLTGTGPFTYQWNTAESSEDLSGLLAGTYSVTITGAGGCSAINSATISEPSILTASITSSTDETYFGACNGTATVSPSGGTGTYDFLWSNSETTAIATNLCAGVYNVTVTDSNGCQVVDFATIGAGPVTGISGTVTFSEGVFAEDEVNIELFFDNGTFMEYVANTNCLSGGSFSFEPLMVEGDYYLRAAVNASASYPNIVVSYYDSTFTWTDATPIAVSFGNVETVDFKMFELTPTTSSGAGNISGTIYYVSLTKDIGEPVPGAEIYLEQEPEGEPIASTETDNDGNYDFIDVPGGNYSLTVDIPGFPQVNTYDITVSEDDTTFTDLNFLVDTTAGDQNIDTSTFTVGISSFENEKFNISVYPSPFKENIDVKVELKSSAIVKLTLLNIEGKKVAEIEKGNLNEGVHIINLNNYIKTINPGTYYISVQINENVYFRKLIKM
ncbi:MAG: VCBS repeat-containing protein [Bacteroidales bacterium]|nr:VCBS repeat-containing protein [Bacteroidales bacterium]